jgi:hypothetical protein|tara:strand:- start:664 stop:1305 length:642 start_codon:yes stop_codon:yes gene_type:complete
MSLRNLEVKVEGTAGLLCSNVQYSDPLGDYCKQKQYFTGKKGKAKTDTVHRAVRILDWLFSGYWVQEGIVEVDEAENDVSFAGFARPYMPGANFQRCLRNAATKWKLGKDVLRSVVVTNNPELDYDGPKDALEMINSRDPKLQLAAFTGRGVWVNRLYLPAWSATFDLTLDDEIMGVDQLRQIANMAGKAEGLGTWRPRYGRFAVSEITEVTE